MKILLDTNFILAPIQLKIDVFKQAENVARGEAEFIILTPVLAELEALSKGKTKTAHAARTMLGYVKKQNWQVMEATGTADSALLQTAKKLGAAIATGDAVLRKRAKQAQVRVLVLKGGYSLTLY
ncbi:MAG TPA: PIN domain-containing protein [Candidatus Norongarragalinales archaeon]|jgi:rRNA-processing protein FCF1|nr:PIN domain-containing protein [Candidatus Norongarragalinales archaeon]